MTDDALLVAYRATRYRVTQDPHDFTLRVGEPSEDLLDLYSNFGVLSAAFLTAHNPFSEPVSKEANEAAQMALLGLLTASGAPFLHGRGEGEDGDWPPEPSVLVLGLTREDAEAIGRRFDQNAILWCGPDAVPILVDLTS